MPRRSLSFALSSTELAGRRAAAGYSSLRIGATLAATPSAAGVRPAVFYATAVPTITSGVGQTGTRRFGITEDGVMHGDSTALTPYADGTAVKAAPAMGL